MRTNNSEYIATIATEIAWLLGSWAIAFGLVGGLVGFNRLLAGPFDVQLHNTYFRLTAGYAVFPIFVAVATVVTGMRGALTRFRYDPIKLVLGLLGIVWVLLFSVFFTLVRSFH